jgi:hypothetical protein
MKRRYLVGTTLAIAASFAISWTMAATKKQTEATHVHGKSRAECHARGGRGVNHAAKPAPLSGNECLTKVRQSRN